MNYCFHCSIRFNGENWIKLWISNRSLGVCQCLQTISSETQETHTIGNQTYICVYRYTCERVYSQLRSLSIRIYKEKGMFIEKKKNNTTLYRVSFFHFTEYKSNINTYDIFSMYE